MILNTLKTVILLGMLTGLLVFLGGLIGGMHGIYYALFFSCMMNGIAYFFSDRLVLRMYKAQPLDPTQYRSIHAMVESLTQTMRMPMPRLWIIQTPMANAFATGRSPKHGSIAITTGILSLLEEHELRGVLAHELSHIKNRDVLVASIAALMATAIGYVAHMLQYAAWWSSFDSKQRRSGNPLVLFLVAILMPIAAMLLQLALSRSREYLADETGAHASSDPLALASALEKLHHHIPHAHLHQTDTQHASTASLFIVHPFTREGVTTLFSTHPPMRSRVARLHTIYENMVRVR